jgi:hypothetical protein
MIPVVPGMLALAALPFTLALLRHWPRLMCGVALAACALPFLLPPSEPILRAGSAFTWLIFVKMLQYAAGHERPRGFLDFLLFIIMPAIVRWETPHHPDLGRAARHLATGLFELGLAALLVVVVVRLDLRNPIELITTQIGLYAVLAGVANIGVVSLSLRGIDYDDPFDNPLAARTPGEFWGRRWNTWVNYLLYRYVFMPSGGRRHPVRGTLAAFAVSGAFHEAAADVGTLSFSGWMLAYFLVQGTLVAATSQARSFRRLARRAPALTWALTVVVMLATGAMLVRGSDGIDPSNAWRRCCR